MEFEEIVQHSDHQIGLDEFYSFALKAAMETEPGIPFLEIGTRAGGTALLLLKAIKESGIERPLITVDPYGGKLYRQDTGIYDCFYHDGFYRDAMVAISKYCKENNLDHFHFHITSSDFFKIYPQVTLWYNRGMIEPAKFAFAYLDGEHCEDSVKEELEWVLPQMVKSGVVVIDDIENITMSTVPIIADTLKASHISHGTRSFFTK